MAKGFAKMNERDIPIMLAALLGNDLATAVGYASGRSSTGDAYIILYPPPPLKYQICKVYQERFGALPFDPVIPPDAVEPKDREHAVAIGNYHELLQPIRVIVVDGKETQMGPERRFFAVLPSSADAYKLTAAAKDARKRSAPQPAKQPAPKQPAPKQPAPQPAKIETPESLAHYLAEARTSHEALFFDTALSKALPASFPKPEWVKRFRSFLGCDQDGETVPAPQAVVAAALAYSRKKDAVCLDAAKAEALKTFASFMEMER